MSTNRSAIKRNKKLGEIQASQRSDKWWKRALVALLVATFAVPLAAYQTGLKNIVEPCVSDVFAWAEDHLRPMPDNKLIGISLRFWDPSDTDKTISLEGLSITIGPKQCRQPGGYSLTRIFANRDFKPNTHALVHVTCRASGRVMVTLTPQSGAATVVYDGRAKDWEQFPFSGVKGSYLYGDVVVTLLDRDPPTGPKEPVNQCQLTNSC